MTFRGSGDSSGKRWAESAEREHGEGDQGVGCVKPERSPGEQSDLGVDRFDAGVGERRRCGGSRTASGIGWAPVHDPVLTSSHVYWTWRLTPRAAAVAVVGAVLPDLPALAVGAVLVGRGRRGRELFRTIYHRPPWREVHLAAHSAFGPLALAARGGRRARLLAAGWGGHLAIDLVSHHDDAWPHLWPLSRRRWRSPVSYWQSSRHATLWKRTETLALAVAVASDVRAPRRAAGLIAMALLHLRRPVRSRARGPRPPPRRSAGPPVRGCGTPS